MNHFFIVFIISSKSLKMFLLNNHKISWYTVFVLCVTRVLEVPIDMCFVNDFQIIYPALEMLCNCETLKDCSPDIILSNWKIGAPKNTDFCPPMNVRNVKNMPA